MTMIYNHENKDPKVVYGCKCWECERAGFDNEFIVLDMNEEVTCPYCGTQDDFAFVPIGLMFPMKVKEIDGGCSYKEFEDSDGMKTTITVEI